MTDLRINKHIYSTAHNTKHQEITDTNEKILNVYQILTDCTKFRFSD